MIVIVRETPPRYVEQWQDGAEGERKTEKALEQLERNGWRVVHDVEAQYGNYDHIAVGPSGVYLLDSKNLQGVTEIRKGVPHVRRRHDPDSGYASREIRTKVLLYADRVKQEIGRTTEVQGVQPVVVFWSEFPQAVVVAGRCVYLHGTELASWLSQRPAKLDPERVEEIAASLDQLARTRSG